MKFVCVLQKRARAPSFAFHLIFVLAMPFNSLSQEDIDLSDQILILSTVAVGNVSQLCTDVLLCNLKLTKIGYFTDPSLIPFVAHDALATTEKECKGEICLGCDVYRCTDSPLVIMQQRCPLVPNSRQFFSRNLCDWIQSSGFRQVVLLTGSHARQRVDTQIRGSQYRYFLSETTSSTDAKETLQTLNWQALEEVHGGHDAMGAQVTGTAKSHFQELSRRKIPTVGFTYFCNEGENTVEGVAFAGKVQQYLDTLSVISSEAENVKEEEKKQPEPTQQLRVPLAWSRCYGPPPERSIYT